MPSPAAILAKTDKPTIAREVHDYLFEQAMQDAIVSGYMYSPLASHAAPQGGKTSPRQ